MTDVMCTEGQNLPWLSWVEPVTQLWQSVPVRAQGRVLLWPSTPAAAVMLQQACQAVGAQAIALQATATPAEVQEAIAQHHPVVVVCPPQVFGWVSKLAFLGGSAAIYTCGAAGEGTLLDRAGHFGVPGDSV